MLKEKLKKKNGNKVQQVKRWQENMYVAQKERELEKRKEKTRRKRENAEEQTSENMRQLLNEFVH